MKHYNKPLAIDKKLGIKKQTRFSPIKVDENGRMVPNDAQIVKMVTTYHKSGAKTTTKMHFYGACCGMTNQQLADYAVSMFNKGGIVDKVVKAVVR